MVPMRGHLRSENPGLSTPPPSPPGSTSSHHSDELYFYPLSNAHRDTLPLQQPDTWSLASSHTPNSRDFAQGIGVDADASVATTLSQVSQASLFSINDAPPLLIEVPTDAPGAVAARSTANPSRLNPAWQSFFRDSLIAADPAATPAIRPVQPPTQTLPPPIHHAPNELSGDDFCTKTAGSFRAWSINAGGISSREDYTDFHTLCVSLKARSIDAIALQEPNLDFMQQDVRHKFQEIFREHFGQVRLVTATSCINAPKTWKPGGVVLAILGPWSQFVTKVSTDDLGRWASATLTGSDGDSFTLFSVYNVVDVALSAAGPATVFSQQYRLLRLAGVTYPNPRLQCIQDLNREVPN
jgi:hypothetical protein